MRYLLFALVAAAAVAAAVGTGVWASAQYAASTYVPFVLTLAVGFGVLATGALLVFMFVPDPLRKPTQRPK